MVDSLKNATAVGVTVVNQTQAGDSLRKNLKSLSPVSVSNQKPQDTQAARSNTSGLQTAISGLADSVKLSAEAIRSLVNYSESDEDEVELAEENIRAASASPEDVQTANESAQRTGALIQFRREEALQAHGKGISADRVLELLSE